MRRFVYCMFLMLGLSVPAAAAQLICNVKDTGDGFVSPVIAAKLEPGQRTGQVYDVFVHEVYGAPIDAKVRKTVDGKYRLSWTVNKVPARPWPIRIAYQAVFDLSNNTVVVRGSIKGVENSINGRGQCQEGDFDK